MRKITERTFDTGKFLKMTELSDKGNQD